MLIVKKENGIIVVVVAIVVLEMEVEVQDNQIHSLWIDNLQWIICMLNKHLVGRSAQKVAHKNIWFIGTLSFQKFPNFHELFREKIDHIYLTYGWLVLNLKIGRKKIHVRSNILQKVLIIWDNLSLIYFSWSGFRHSCWFLFW